MLVLPVERVVRLLGMERLFHVKHMCMGLILFLLRPQGLRCCSIL